MIDNFEYYGGYRYLVSRYIEIEFFIVYGIEVMMFDVCISFGYVYFVIV